jgi:organic hydroperoxide reductase OsmC/OhrA
MAEKQHLYAVNVRWTGNEGQGTASTRAYSRSHLISAAGKPDIEGSSDPSFRGDPAKWNPEELLLASLSACHQLWYLGLCAQAGIIVTAYEDNAQGTMIEQPSGAGQFTRVVLHPSVALAPGSDRNRAEALHHTAHEICFIALRELPCRGNHRNSTGNEGWGRRAVPPRPRSK